jgi:hypothetical protein
VPEHGTPPDTGAAALAYWSEHREQFRQSENQRAVLTNFVLVIAAGLGGLVVQQDFRPRTLPLSVLMIVIGLYGALAVAKYHERATYHLSQARALTRQLVSSGGLADQGAVLAEFREAHYQQYPRLSRLRLNWLWTGLHLGVAAYAAVLVIITLVSWN